MMNNNNLFHDVFIFMMCHDKDGKAIIIYTTVIWNLGVSYFLLSGYSSIPKSDKV